MNMLIVDMGRQEECEARLSAGAKVSSERPLEWGSYCQRVQHRERISSLHT